MPFSWTDFVNWAGWGWTGWNALTAVGTTGAVVVALFLAERESRRRAASEARSQAEFITAWISGQPLQLDAQPVYFARLIIQNGSNELVYKLIASWRGTRGAGGQAQPGSFELRTLVGEVPPGRSEFQTRLPGYGMNARAAIELAFQDAAGRRWLRDVDGNLGGLKGDVLTHYGLYEPAPWKYPSEAVPSIRPA
jgi:hypothetical protein